MQSVWGGFQRTDRDQRVELPLAQSIESLIARGQTHFDGGADAAAQQGADGCEHVRVVFELGRAQAEVQVGRSGLLHLPRGERLKLVEADEGVDGLLVERRAEGSGLHAAASALEELASDLAFEVGD